MKKSELFCLLGGKKFFLNSNNYATVMSILEEDELKWVDGLTANRYVSDYFKLYGECYIYISKHTYPNVIMHSSCDFGREEIQFQLVDIDELLIQHGYTSDDIDIDVSIGEVFI